MMNNNICPRCEGRGTIFNKISLLLTVAWPIAWLVDREDGSGMTRETCPRCDGTGEYK